MNLKIIERSLTKIIKERLFRNKAILVLGPRQVGKSTLCLQLLEQLGDPYLVLNGDESDV